MPDQREINHRWYESFDEKRMVVVVFDDDDNEVEVSVEYEVCNTCEGRGSHVNPSIDSNGLTSEDFDQYPDFEEDYFSGMYDVPCAECGGTRVVPSPSLNNKVEVRELAQRRRDEHYRDQWEQAREREMGY